MSGKTAGRRAYDAWWATAEGVPRHPDVTYDQDADAWEAAAAAGAAAARERAAELVTEVNGLRDDFLFERKQVIELRQVLTEVFTCMNTADMSLPDADQIDEWRQRAGLDDDDAPAVVTAGTEHLAEKIRGLAIPDEL